MISASRFAGRLREEAGQLSWFLKEYRSPRRWGVQAKSNRGMRLPKLPLRRRVPGSVWAVAMVRDEEDIVGHTVRHLLNQGVDHVLVADNLSQDGTPEILSELAARDPRVHVGEDRVRAYYQAEKMSHLARVAWQHGADWVIPFDADEFWFAEGKSLAEFFKECSGGLVYAKFHNMVSTSENPADMEFSSFVLDSTPAFPGKVAVKAHPFVVMGSGNHTAMRVGGVGGQGLRIAHAKYRSPRQIGRKLRQGAEAVMLTDPADNIALHWRKGVAYDDDQVRDIWNTIRAGLTESLIDHEVHGPMVEVTPLQWSTWDPADEIPNIPQKRP